MKKISLYLKVALAVCGIGICMVAMPLVGIWQWMCGGVRSGFVRLTAALVRFLARHVTGQWVSDRDEFEAGLSQGFDHGRAAALEQEAEWREAETERNVGALLALMKECREVFAEEAEASMQERGRRLCASLLDAPAFDESNDPFSIWKH